MLRPIGDRILIKPLTEEEKTAGGIFLPDTAKEKPQKGEVIELGSGKILENGQKIPWEVKKGDIVIFSKYGGTEMKHDGVDYLILKESDVLAVIEKEKKK